MDWRREKMKEEQKKVVLSNEEIKEIEEMADFVDEIGDNIRELEEKTLRFFYYLENLAKRIEAIEDKTKAEEFSQSLLYLSDCFYEISQQNKKMAITFYINKCAKIADDLAAQAENMVEQEIKKEEAKND